MYYAAYLSGFLALLDGGNLLLLREFDLKVTDQSTHGTR